MLPTKFFFIKLFTLEMLVKFKVAGNYKMWNKVNFKIGAMIYHHFFKKDVISLLSRLLKQNWFYLKEQNLSLRYWVLGAMKSNLPNMLLKTVCFIYFYFWLIYCLKYSVCKLSEAEF